ncbi:hypothetical protein VB834_22055 [Limnoraphis robusta Tam1]|uniref:Uncharacterized protein n=1 Tax=Limnoraphis robusta CCNP1315 TaxID=3110306 RepID=A0ABU5UAB8_9CYAN|nr:hypothetical protein [Limnoraphis robusta]MEA5523063.1 hypothetical protein [Limnoraphis robusta CCNP1315]MEA5541716.1 hypothetical protein [Limnoraphis robusta Tam1]MEA5548740.1 hypothetical protein [Limnoraphis robusta CCNP1324]
MKCIHCGTDNNLKERISNQGRCKECNSPFAFEPTTMKTVKITDAFFANALKDISINDTLFFTKKQLFYLLEKRYKRKKFTMKSNFYFLIMYLFLNVIFVTLLGGFIVDSVGMALSVTIVNSIYQMGIIFYLFSCSKGKFLNNRSRNSATKNLKMVGFIILFAGIWVSLFIVNSFTLFCTILLLGLFSIYLGFKQANKPEFSQELIINPNEFQQWLYRWEQVNGTYPKLLPSPLQSLQPATVNPDIINYSFDRLIVCDTAEIAQFLIANNFHFEHNCAIFSKSGYPQNIFKTTMQMLRRNPYLQVYALHSCTPRGMTLVHHLRTSQSWFLDTNQVIIDLGITPRQVLENEGRMLIESSPNSAKYSLELPIEIRGSLSPEELKWLDAGNFVELESFPPQQLIQIIQRGITRDLSLNSAGSDSIFVEDSDNSLYVFQSFG